MSQVIDVERLDELVVGDTLYVGPIEVVQGNLLIPPNALGFGKKHRAGLITKLREFGIHSEPMTGLGQLVAYDVGASKNYRFQFFYGLRVTAIDQSPELEPLRAGFPVIKVIILVGGLAGLALFGVVIVDRDHPLWTLSRDLIDAGKAPLKGLAIALPIAAVAGLWWVSKQP